MCKENSIINSLNNQNRTKPTYMRTNRLKLIGIVACFSTTTCGMLAQTTLIEDDGTSTSGWLLSTTGTAITLDTTTQAGYMTWNPGNNTANMHLLKYFTAHGSPQSLAVGDNLTATVDFILTGIVVNANQHRLRFGLYDSTVGTRVTVNGHGLAIGAQYNGYMGTFSANSGTATHLLQKLPASTSFLNQAIGGTFTETLTASNDGGVLTDNTPYRLTISITRTASGNDVAYTMSGGPDFSITGSDTDGAALPFYAFDTLAFAVLDSGAGGAITDWRFDNIKVVYTAFSATTISLLNGSFNGPAFDLNVSTTQPTLPHVLSRSVDLSSWSPVATNTPGASPFVISDPAPPADAAFYRVSAP